MDNLHTALKHEILGRADSAGIQQAVVRLIMGKNKQALSLHCRPNTWGSAGVQSTDFLGLLGFQRSSCQFLQPECYSSPVPLGFELPKFSSAVEGSFDTFKRAFTALERCGFHPSQPEGWGFFYGKSSEGREFRSDRPGDGHNASKVKPMKRSEDNFFHYAFTWIEKGHDMGWVTHYHAKKNPISAEMAAAMEFLDDFGSFKECPEFDFEPCQWRFIPYREDSGFFNSSAQYANSIFDSHTEHFSEGVKTLLEAHALIAGLGFSFLKVENRPSDLGQKDQSIGSGSIPDSFDVAISFAGKERPLAQRLAEKVRAAGFQVFYDDFYPSQLWGKNLVDFFDGIYRKRSRFCAVFVSQDYLNGMWTEHERKSAQDRALRERGKEYLLPIQVDESELPGMATTIGYVSLAKYDVDRIADLLIDKLHAAK